MPVGCAREDKGRTDANRAPRAVSRQQTLRERLVLMAFHPQPKPRPEKLEKADRLRTRVSIDEKESAKVRERSGGRCEIEVNRYDKFGLWASSARCSRRGLHVHHKLGGFGVRGRGDSAKAINKLHLCNACHSDIHAHVLVPDGQYWRRVQ